MSPENNYGLYNPVAVDASGDVYARGPESEVAKYDQGDGGRIWATPFGDGDGSEVISIALDPSGNVYALGMDSGVVLTVKYDPDGTRLWSSPIAAAGTAAVTPISLAVHGSSAHTWP